MAAIPMMFARPAAISISENIFWSRLPPSMRTIAPSPRAAIVPHPGLSMGGFMSLYLSARYPQIIGSCSAFNPGPEFYVGEKGRRSLWRPKDYVLSFQHTPVRLVRASGDYISQYTEETRAAFAATPSVDFEFRQDEYDRHWATSIAETFDFHMRAFADPALDTTPTQWNYASAFDRFDAWGYHVQADIAGPAMIYLSDVSKSGDADHNASMGSGWAAGCVHTIESDDGRPLSELARPTRSTI